MNETIGVIVLGQLSRWWAMQHLPMMVFVFSFGACVGSFINVVIYRVPAGMSVISPPSRCPTCGARLQFFGENLPILGWLLLRGRCRYCSARISIQYMLVELFMAMLFLGAYWVLYATSTNMNWAGQIGGVWWTRGGLMSTWPAFITWTFLLAGLFAMTVIDARTFLIPIQIPTFITVTAFIAYPLQALLRVRAPANAWPIPGVSWQWFLASLLGMLGLIFSYVQLKRGKLRYSFSDYDQYVKEGETLAEYPHARREMLIELRYLLPCIVGLAAGFIAGRLWLPADGPPRLVQAIGASLLGYLVGGGMIWSIRILGSLGFGKEAMGMGDVHLLAAVGAVLGWFDPILIFFLAPFSGILWAFSSMGIAAMFRRARRELPYGPHLAIATFLLIVCRPGLHSLWLAYMGNVPMPQPGLIP